MTKHALVLGATGLVGKHLLETLACDFRYGKVSALIRRPLSLSHPKIEPYLIDFQHLSQYAHLFQVDEVFCCLGTTRKKAKTKKQYLTVDYKYPLKAAKLAKAQGVQQFLLVSAMGASPNSPFFYFKLKGRLEQSLTKLELPSLHIFRPSLLLGKRDEFRLGEKTAALFHPLVEPILVGKLKSYRAIHAKTVAEAMVEVARQEKPGTHIYLSPEIEKWGKLRNSGSLT